MTGETGRRRGSSVVLERLPYDSVAWETIIARYPSAEVFHSPGWLAFLVSSQGAEPVVAVVRVDGQPVGHFVGAIVRRFGVRILGSPLRGWGTESMGFLGGGGFDRRAAAEALVPFAFGELGCLHVDLADRWLAAEQMVGSGYVVDPGSTFIVDLESAEETVLGRMHSTKRRYIRQAVRRGLRIEIATDIEFADEYYEQLKDVFGRQGLVPTYDVDRVRHLIRSLQPTGQLLLLRVRSPDGTCLATSISFGRNQTAVLWGAASFRGEAKNHPNEPLWWEVMHYWREKGAVRFDMGGGGDYKADYGGVITPVVHFHRSRFAPLRFGRAAVSRLVAARQIPAGLRRRRARPGSPGAQRAVSGRRSP
jgi:CelD/BcsL family acetyltransferase involved in cellulose biosynthesis